MNHSDSTTIEDCGQSPCDHHWHCALCRMCFIDEFSLDKHNASYHQYRYRCKNARCKGREFRSAYGLKEHLRQAAVHRHCDVALCALCGQRFNSTHDVLLHLDSGGCEGITWRWVLQLAKVHDEANDFVDPDVEISKRPGLCTGTRCVTCGNSFNGTVMLNRHLASPVHQPKLLMCPATGCSSRFSTLSGLAQHIETGTKRCSPMSDGGAREKWETFLAKIGLVYKP